MVNLNEVISQGSAAGSIRLFSMRHEFPQSWARFTSQTQGEDDRCELAITLRPEHYPFWSQGRLNKVVAVDLLAKSTTDSASIAVYAQADSPANEADLLNKNESLNDLLVGWLKNVSLPEHPTGEFKLYFESSDLNDLWISIFWKG